MSPLCRCLPQYHHWWSLRTRRASCSRCFCTSSSGQCSQGGHRCRSRGWWSHRRPWWHHWCSPGWGQSSRILRGRGWKRVKMMQREYFTLTTYYMSSKRHQNLTKCIGVYMSHESIRLSWAYRWSTQGGWVWCHGRCGQGSSWIPQGWAGSQSECWGTWWWHQPRSPWLSERADQLCTHHIQKHHIHHQRGREVRADQEIQEDPDMHKRVDWYVDSCIWIPRRGSFWWVKLSGLPNNQILY